MDSTKEQLRGSLVFSETKIELALHVGEVFSGAFDIEELSGLSMEGCIYSSTIRMHVDKATFSGTKTTIHYSFDSEGMQPGDVLKGTFSIVSNMGEYVLSFVVMINHEVLESSLGPIKNLFHFTNLAKSEWSEAVRVFSLPGFIDIITGNDAKYRDLYIGLCGHGNKNYALDEFLIGINKKQIAEYKLSKDELRLTNPQGDVETSVFIERNGWGYALFAVKAEGDFIELSTNRISENDFYNNQYEFNFRILEGRLHSGKNYGRIIFKYLYGTLSVDICVANVDLVRKSITGHKRKSVNFSLVRYYLDYCNKTIGKNKWVQLSEELLSHRASIDNDGLENNLYQTYLLLLQERYNEAKWILDRRIADVIEDAPNELYCFYLYLMALYNVDDYYTREISSTIKSIYEKDPTNWRVAWVLMHTSDELKRNPSRMYAFALRQIEFGCTSPILFVEVVRLLNSMPSLLVHFDNEEKVVLDFAAKNNLMSPELANHVAYQALKQREFDKKTLRILINISSDNEDADIVQAICSQLMKGDLIGEQYFDWYKKGIENNFSITRLYECYMMSLNLVSDQPIPREVLMYFSYQSTLPMEQSAYLYAYVVRNKEELSDIYETYTEAIERFVVKQLYAEKINRDLAYLYQEVLMRGMATVDNIRQFSKILLTHCIRIPESGIVNVVVMDERLKQEIVYPVHNKMAFVTLPSSDYTVLLEDSVGNRFYGTKEYSTERYFLPRKLLPKIEVYTEDSLLFDLYVCEGNKDHITVTERNVGRYAYLEQHDAVNDVFKAAIRMPLLRYYQDREDVARIDELLDSTVGEDIPYKDRDEFLRILVSRGLVSRAFNYIRYYGSEEIDPKIVARVASMVIERDGMVCDSELTYMVESAFNKGKYNETLLTYLVLFYQGTVKNLRNIWKAASGFYVDTYVICEKMIKQSLWTGAYIGEEVQILREYVEGGAKSDVELDYLEYFAHEHFVRDRIVDGYMFQEMVRLYDNNEPVPVVCMLAYLKYYSETTNFSKLSEAEIDHIRRFIQVIYSEHNMFLPFMQNYKSISTEALEMSNMTMIEIKATPGARVTINYIVTDGKNDSEGYTREEMVNVYGGVFVKSFLLFFGETVQYYITEEYEGMEQLTESGTLIRNDVDTDSITDRYSMVNDIAIADALKDYDTALELLDEYKYKEYITKKLFRLQ